MPHCKKERSRLNRGSSLSAPGSVSRTHRSSTHLVVASRHSKDVCSDGPAHVPDNVIELVQQLRGPGVSRGVVTRPDKHPAVLRSEQTAAARPQSQCRKNSSDRADTQGDLPTPENSSPVHIHQLEFVPRMRFHFPVHKSEVAAS